MTGPVGRAAGDGVGNPGPGTDGSDGEQEGDERSNSAHRDLHRGSQKGGFRTGPWSSLLADLTGRR